MKKLLKYDLKSVFKIWWIPLVVVSAIFVLSCFGALMFRQAAEEMNWLTEDDFAFSVQFARVTSGALLVFLGAAAIWAFGILGLVMPLIRYAQSFFTDQAYLTFTLPVKNKSLYHSKLATALIFYGITTVVQLLFVLILGYLLLNGEPLDGIMERLEYSTAAVVVFKLLLMLVQGAVQVLTWQFAFNIGGFLPRSNKGLFIVLAVFCTLIGKGVVQSVFSPPVHLMSSLAVGSSYWVGELLSDLVKLCLELVVGWICYLVSRHLIEKKVNLA